MKTFQTFDISAEYDAIHRTFPCHKDAPVIGLTGNFQEGACTLLEGYFTSILKAGGIPFIIPPVDETNSLINSLNALDGLLLTGGADINPLFLGEEPIKELHSINPRRDRQELLLAKLAADRQIPILGICRGIQAVSYTHLDVYKRQSQMFVHTPSYRQFRFRPIMFPFVIHTIAERPIIPIKIP